MRRGGVDAPAYRQEYDQGLEVFKSKVVGSVTKVGIQNRTNYPLDVAVFAVNKVSNLGYRVSPIIRVPAENSELVIKTAVRFLQSRSSKCEIPELVFYLPYQPLATFDRQYQLFVYFAVSKPPTSLPPSFSAAPSSIKSLTMDELKGCWVETVGVMCHRKPIISSVVTIVTNDLFIDKTNPLLTPESCMPAYATNAWTKGSRGEESGGKCRTAGHSRTSRRRRL
jgi:hypothetical protein